MTKPYNTDRRVERSARLTWVALGLMRYPTMAQRDKINQGRVSMIAANMDLEQLGTPTVNKRHGQYHVLDGMHRVEAYKLWIGDGWENQQLQCWTYTDLTETEEAEVFLKLNDTLAIPAFDRFRIGLNAGRLEETEIAAVVAVTRLASVSGGLAGLMNRAAVTRNQTNAPLATCIAAAAVELINRGRGGTKLPAWWKSEPAAQDKAS
jgi:hypothetical protein